MPCLHRFGASMPNLSQRGPHPRTAWFPEFDSEESPKPRACLPRKDGACHACTASGQACQTCESAAPHSGPHGSRSSIPKKVESRAHACPETVQAWHDERRIRATRPRFNAAKVLPSGPAQRKTRGEDQATDCPIFASRKTPDTGSSYPGSVRLVLPSRGTSRSDERLIRKV